MAESPILTIFCHHFDLGTNLRMKHLSVFIAIETCQNHFSTISPINLCLAFQSKVIYMEFYRPSQNWHFARKPRVRGKVAVKMEWVLLSVATWPLMI